MAYVVGVAAQRGDAVVVLGEEGDYRIAGRSKALQEARLQLEDDHRPIVTQDPSHASEDGQLGSFHVDLDEADAREAPLHAQRVEGRAGRVHRDSAGGIGRGERGHARVRFRVQVEAYRIVRVSARGVGGQDVLKATTAHIPRELLHSDRIRLDRENCARWAHTAGRQECEVADVRPDIDEY